MPFQAILGVFWTVRKWPCENRRAKIAVRKLPCENRRAKIAVRGSIPEAPLGMGIIQITTTSSPPAGARALLFARACVRDWQSVLSGAEQVWPLWPSAEVKITGKI